MNAQTQKLLAWAEGEVVRLEAAGRTGGQQYQSALGWASDAKKLSEVPADYVWPDVDEQDPRTWATMVMALDPRLGRFVRLGIDMPQSA
jgi:hypothetical protein